MMDRLRRRIDAFLSEWEAEWAQIDRAHRRRPALGVLYRENDDLFATERITEVQRVLAGAGGGEERRTRAVLEFLARGRAMCQAGEQLDHLLGWEIFGSVPLEENRIPVRQISGALGVAADPARRHAIEEAYLDTLDEQAYLAEDFLARHREAISELGYGTHVEAFQVLGSIDLEAIVRKGERFLASTDDVYRELLNWHLPKIAGVNPGEARAADGYRLEAAARYDGYFPGTERYRQIVEMIRSTGLPPLAEGRIRVDWEAYLGAAGATCRTVEVPDDVRLQVTPGSGRPAADSFLDAYGLALHHAYTDPELPLESRRLGDSSVTIATGSLFRGLLRNPEFMQRVFEMPGTELPDYLRLAALNTLLRLRRDVGRLRYELAWYRGEAGGAEFSEIMAEATGLIYDPREAIWQVDGEFRAARRLRAAQLAGILATTIRNRFDEDWFRNPDAGDYLRKLFWSGRRYSAPELSVQLSSTQLTYEPLIQSLDEIT